MVSEEKNHPLDAETALPAPCCRPGHSCRSAAVSSQARQKSSRPADKHRSAADARQVCRSHSFESPERLTALPFPGWWFLKASKLLMMLFEYHNVTLILCNAHIIDFFFWKE